MTASELIQIPTVNGLWPAGGFDPAATALLLVDWQHDFCGPGGYLEAMGYDISLTRAGIAPTRQVLDLCRHLGMLIVHTREGHAADMADCPANKLWRSRRIGAGIGDPGPCGRILIRGEEGWNIVEELEPYPWEHVVDKPSKGAFTTTDIDLVLRSRGIRNLIITGITTDVCVHTILREANDRGYRCLLLSDCTGAADLANRDAAIKVVTIRGGAYGAVTDSSSLIDALNECAPV